ncbi:MAG: DUF4870 domain-containing protein [Alphaproteobacteria bacterium]|nr:DUF4870 domain-containing protein [Alphaproteobacteria bacterium]
MPYPPHAPPPAGPPPAGPTDAPDPGPAHQSPRPPRAAPMAPERPLGEPTPEERTMAMIGHGLTFVEGGIVGPLLVYLLKRDQSEFVAFHALQSLYFGLLALLIIGPATVITCGFGAVLVVPYFIFEVIACIEANKGEWYELPIVGAWAMRSHHP